MDSAASNAVLQERRLDTRRKIQLGGLLVKAGLRHADKAALYGGILELAERLKDEGEAKRLHALGAPELEPVTKPKAKSK